MKIKLVSILMFGILLLVPTIASAEVTDGNVGYGLTPGRLRTIIAAVVGLISVIIGGLSWARSAGRFGSGNGRTGAIVAAVVGLIGIVLAGLHLANTTGGFGTGNGRAGAIVAILVGLAGLVLAWLTLARSRRVG
ncbi:DUF6223 family protein [Paenibacillus sp. CC-CFT747]|nr:DUF6223 family protein [Paenibacillus sp. CC-CFT747]